MPVLRSSLSILLLYGSSLSPMFIFLASLSLLAIAPSSAPSCLPFTDANGLSLRHPVEGEVMFMVREKMYCKGEYALRLYPPVNFYYSQSFASSFSTLAWLPPFVSFVLWLGFFFYPSYYYFGFTGMFCSFQILGVLYMFVVYCVHTHLDSYVHLRILLLF